MGKRKGNMQRRPSTGLEGLQAENARLRAALAECQRDNLRIQLEFMALKPDIDGIHERLDIYPAQLLDIMRRFEFDAYIGTLNGLVDNSKRAQAVAGDVARVMRDWLAAFDDDKRQSGAPSDEDAALLANGYAIRAAAVDYAKAGTRDAMERMRALVKPYYLLGRSEGRLELARVRRPSPATMLYGALAEGLEGMTYRERAGAIVDKLQALDDDDAAALLERLDEQLRRPYDDGARDTLRNLDNNYRRRYKDYMQAVDGGQGLAYASDEALALARELKPVCSVGN
jgi:hypothetical protein